jgi:hypothetical protein
MCRRGGEWLCARGSRPVYFISISEQMNNVHAGGADGDAADLPATWSVLVAGMVVAGASS